jgi:AcrR family transcriptional regulator
MKPEPTDLTAKGRILRAAEMLFAERGLDAVSLREVAIQAGQKNTNAVQYHFGSKEGLVRAIWERHATGIEAHRAALLAQAEGDLALAEAVDMLVTPVLAKLDDPDSGREYLLIMSQLVSNPQQNILSMYKTLPEPSSVVLIKRLEHYASHLSGADKKLRILFVLGILFHGIADYIRLQQAHAALVDDVPVENLKTSLIRTICAAITSS